MNKAFLLPALVLLLSSCAQKVSPTAGNSGTDAAVDCNAVMCTMEFRTVSIQVTDAQGAPFKLDSYRTVLTGKGTPVSTGDGEMTPAEGTYPIVTDAWVSGHRNTTTKMIFMGFKGGKPVVTETFEIKADCCHISRVSGKETVVAR